MSDLQSINPEIHASDGLPSFLGDPNAKPDPRLPQFPWYLITAAAGIIGDHTKRDPWPPPELVLRRIIQAALKLGPEEAEKCFFKFLSSKTFWHTDPDILWDTLSEALRPPKLIVSLPPLKTNHDVESQREIRPHPIVKPSPQPGSHAALQAYYSRIRSMPLFEFIDNELENTTAARAWECMLKHSNRKIATRGHAFYTCGVAFLSRELRLKQRTVERAVSFLKKKKVIIRRTPPDYKHHKCAVYLVAISTFQVIRFRT